MSILILESSSKKIEFGCGNFSELLVKKTLPEENNADTLTFFIKKELLENEIDIRSIEYLVLSNGPGSFTGLRIGSAIAKGLCFILDCRLIEVSTLEVIANKISSGGTVTSLIFSNMRTGEFYFGNYERDNGNLKLLSSGISDLDEISSKFSDSQFASNDAIKNFNYENVSSKPNIESLYELSIKYIKEKKFTEFNFSQPFYMKEFTPKV